MAIPNGVFECHSPRARRARRRSPPAAEGDTFDLWWKPLEFPGRTFLSDGFELESREQPDNKRSGRHEMWLVAISTNS